MIDWARDLTQPNAHVSHEHDAESNGHERGQDEINQGEHDAMNVASSVRLYGVRRKLARLRAGLPPYRLTDPCAPCGSRLPGASITTRVGDGPDVATAPFCSMADTWVASTCFGVL